MAALLEPSTPETGFRSELGATARLALPLILGGFAQMAINTVDVLILGRYDVAALAASALALNLLWAMAIFGIGVVTAASPLIAAERGRRPYSVREVRRTVRQAWWASALLCVPIWLVAWHAEAVFALLGQEPALSRAAAGFLRIAMWGTLPFLLYVVLRLYVTSLERPVWGLVVTAGGVAFNALSCWTLVFGHFGFPELGLTGAAIANFLANLFLFLGMATVVSSVRRFRRYRLFGRFWRSDWPRFRELLRLGLPIGVTLALEITIFNAAVFLMGLIDRASLAAHAIAIQIAALAFQLPFGIAQAATVRVGLFHGRGDRAGIARAGHAALSLGLGAAILLSLGIALGSEGLTGLFLGRETQADRQVFDLTISFLWVAAWFQLFDGAQTIGAGMLRGIQDTRWPMAYAAFGYWVVGIIVAVWLGFHTHLRGVGIWIGLASGLAAVAALMLGRWALRDRLRLGAAG
ncbi:MATE family efflux transporter [Sphingosinicella ginsenosidimutans]|uniref:MATE family efflux transporter n=1 Tax=Allosphingosinicella ginsenosidimutans TaxID=1176539 RepID=A0A5C6TRJ7_9SPHN|nr:MATE family efflux transporter [Sphingosinicella ginsenosidimutans]TXC62856.1 MATE family efflux transporter [Sphingosinicella ginsenosidimutans]